MFPDKVGRVLIDGVANAHDYYIGMFHSTYVLFLWSSNFSSPSANYTSSLLNSEQALTNVYEACFEAGPAVCAIYENSTDLIRARVSNLIDSVHRAPLTLYDDSDPSNIQLAVVDYSLVTQTLGEVVYSPYSLASEFAEAVVQMEQGNGTFIFEAAPGNGADNAQQNLFSCDPNLPQPFSSGGIEIVAAIGCGDRLNPVATGLQASLPIYQGMTEVSPFYGPIFFAESNGPCAYVSFLTMPG